jgi:hypothetical protein
MKSTVRIFILWLVIIVLSMCHLFSAGAETADPSEMPAVDLDLSGMSGTVVYAQIYNLLSDPAPWLGKTIRMAGYYSFYDDQEQGIVYHACVIPDATACCAQGIEFVWAGEHNWPDDYPEDGADITVTGRLEIYEENGYSYLHLMDADVLWGTQP